jgi:FkbM family methyltransferase
MGLSLSKLLRTLQSEFPGLKGLKDSYYYHSRKLLSKPHESDFLALRFIPDDLPGCYVDVGANHGQSIEAIKAVKKQARVYSFEANGMLAERLIARYRGRADITVQPFGLADEELQLTLYVPAYNGFVYDGLASFDKASAANWLSPDTLYWFSPKKLVLQETTCNTRRFDDQGLQPLFIKIDVQGYEYQVIKGGVATIRQHEPILLIEDFHWEAEIGSLLGGLGYQQYLFDENGFYPARDDSTMNKFLMTPRRAATLKLSPRAAQVK